MAEISVVNIQGKSYDFEDEKVRGLLQTVITNVSSKATQAALNGLEEDVHSKLDMLRKLVNETKEDIITTLEMIQDELEDPTSEMQSYLDVIYGYTKGLDGTTVLGYLEEKKKEIDEHLAIITASNTDLNDVGSKTIKEAIDDLIKSMEEFEEAIQKTTDIIVNLDIINVYDTHVEHDYKEHQWVITNNAEEWRVYGENKVSVDKVEFKTNDSQYKTIIGALRISNTSLAFDLKLTGENLDLVSKDMISVKINNAVGIIDSIMSQSNTSLELSCNCNVELKTRGEIANIQLVLELIGDKVKSVTNNILNGTTQAINYIKNSNISGLLSADGFDFIRLSITTGYGVWNDEDRKVTVDFKIPGEGTGMNKSNIAIEKSSSFDDIDVTIDSISNSATNGYFTGKMTFTTQNDIDILSAKPIDFQITYGDVPTTEHIYVGHVCLCIDNRDAVDIPGSIILGKKSNYKEMTVVKQHSLHKYPSSDWSPLGMVAIPANHDVYGTGEYGVVSLVNMDCSNPTYGGSGSSMVYGPDAGLTLKAMAYVPVCGTCKSPTIDLTDSTSGYSAYLPSDYFSGAQCAHDESSFYYDSSNNYAVPSPYLSDYSRNPIYYQTTSPSTTLNCLSDFDGREHTNVILSQRTEKIGEKNYSSWKPTRTELDDYPGVSCCDMFCPVKNNGGPDGMNQHDWYLPSAGEFGYVLNKLNTIRHGISLLKEVYNDNASDFITTYYTSTKCSSSYVETINVNTGNIRQYPGDNKNEAYLRRVRAFTRLKDPNFESKTSNVYEYVDLGLSVNWATCNVGATKPEESGLYFAWGDTKGCESATDKEGGFNWNTTKYCLDSNGNKFSKYVASSSYGTVDNKTVLDLEDDAAHVNMGGSWRMPTKEEFQELYNACNVTWVENYNGSGINGRLFTLKKDSSKQVFFPAAGYGYNSSVYIVGSSGNYWSSSLYTSGSNNAYFFGFSSDGMGPQSSNERYYGYSIRPVLPK